MGFKGRFFVQTIIGACAPFGIVLAVAIEVLLLVLEVLFAGGRGDWSLWQPNGVKWTFLLKHPRSHCLLTTVSFGGFDGGKGDQVQPVEDLNIWGLGRDLHPRSYTPEQTTIILYHHHHRNDHNDVYSTVYRYDYH